MTKKTFTTRLDPAVLAAAQRIAKAERRSVTAVIELAVLTYAEAREREADRRVEDREKPDAE